MVILKMHQHSWSSSLSLKKVILSNWYYFIHQYVVSDDKQYWFLNHEVSSVRKQHVPVYLIDLLNFWYEHPRVQLFPDYFIKIIINQIRVFLNSEVPGKMLVFPTLSNVQTPLWNEMHNAEFLCKQEQYLWNFHLMHILLALVSIVRNYCQCQLKFAVTMWLQYLYKNCVSEPGLTLFNWGL